MNSDSKQGAISMAIQWCWNKKGGDMPPYIANELARVALAALAEYDRAELARGGTVGFGLAHVAIEQEERAC